MVYLYGRTKAKGDVLGLSKRREMSVTIYHIAGKVLWLELKEARDGQGRSSQYHQ